MTKQPKVTNRVDKVIRVVASSPVSWSEAARNAVTEVAKTMHGLSTARLVETDVLVRERSTLYRVKLEVQFRLDRTRTDAAGKDVQVRRYLIVANQTLATEGLQKLLDQKLGESAAEFHVLVPYVASSTSGDHSGLLYPNMQARLVEDHNHMAAEAEEQLNAFKRSFAGLGSNLTAEVASGDPIAAMRRIMERSSFDEIILSTLPVRLSRWLKLDLPARIERAFNLPLTTLVQHEDHRD